MKLKNESRNLRKILRNFNKTRGYPHMSKIEFSQTKPNNHGLLFRPYSLSNNY